MRLGIFSTETRNKFVYLHLKHLVVSFNSRKHAENETEIGFKELKTKDIRCLLVKGGTMLTYGGTFWQNDRWYT